MNLILPTYQTYVISGFSAETKVESSALLELVQGWILFLFYINDLSDVVGEKVPHFADDVKLIAP